MHDSTDVSRRQFLKTTALGSLATGFGIQGAPLRAQQSAAPAGERAFQAEGVKVLYPRARVPASFIIDDSTCLVNMGHFCMPQFAQVWPNRDEYKKPWRTWPREIPDAFVREFGQWCAEHGVKGKYSVVPYPALVGWLDRELPGWSRRQRLDSLKLVRELMMPNWDIHPEMITHTRVIDLKTGRPMENISAATMENSYPQEKKSVDELAAYLAHALRILKNCELPCEGITTPGGFGNRVKSNLSLAVHEAVRDVFSAELPHYFKYIVGRGESTEPKLEHVRGLDGEAPRVTVNVPAGTGDWFGGWHGDRKPEGHRYVNEDATAGRMVELIQRRQPAIMFCHWPGLYRHGTKQGFEHFKRCIVALSGRFGDDIVWMKVSEIARYWAAKELTRIDRQGDAVTFTAPFAAPNFTVAVPAGPDAVPALRAAGKPIPLKEVRKPSALKAGTFHRHKTGVTVCFDLGKGKTGLKV